MFLILVSKWGVAGSKNVQLDLQTLEMAILLQDALSAELLTYGGWDESVYNTLKLEEKAGL